MRPSDPMLSSFTGEYSTRRSGAEPAVLPTTGFGALSLNLKLPLFAAGLVLFVGLALATAAVLEMRRTSLAVASSRLLSVTAQFDDLFRQSVAQAKTQVAALASNPAVTSYARTRSAAARSEALRQLTPSAAQAVSIAGAELRDPAGRVVLSGLTGLLASNTVPLALDAAPKATPDSARVGTFRMIDDTVFYPVVADVKGGGVQVVQWRRLVNQSRQRDQLQQLIGLGSKLFLGNADGSLWTDLQRAATPLPVTASRPARIQVIEDAPNRESQLVTAVPIPGSPWMFAIAFPQRSVLAPIRLFVLRLGVITLACMAIAIFTAWYGSRRITRQALDSLMAKVQVAEREAQRSQEDYRTVFASSPVAKVIVDRNTLRLVSANDAASRLYGYEPEKLTQMPLAALVTQDERTGLDAAVRGNGASNGGAPDHVRAERHLTKDGRVREVEVRVTNLAGARPTQLRSIIDVTDRNEAERQLRRLNEELEARVQRRTRDLEVANKELESFAYSVSHDLRTPLRALDGFGQALLEDYAHVLDETGRGYLNRIRRGSQRMSDLIDAMLQLSRVSRGELRREPVNLSGLARETVEALRLAHPGRQVEVVLDDGLEATGDAPLLRTLLDNLLGNAWKFTAKVPNARIAFGASTDQRRGRVFSVQDNGAGFDMIYADKLFGAFQRLHSNAEFDGTGIGLATAQRIVHRHGGDIWAEARANAGASFFFTLGRS